MSLGSLTPISLLRTAERSLSRADGFLPLQDVRNVGRVWSRELIARRRVPPIPRNALVPLEQTPNVILRCSRSAWDFHPQTYAQESAFAHELAARGESFALADSPDQVADKAVAWFLPENLMMPRLWDYSLQVQEFARGLEAQGNSLFCSAQELSFWENKAHMHRRLADVGAPTPPTRILTADNWASMEFDLEPVLIKQEHSGGSIGLHHFTSAGDARAFVARYRFRPTESLIMQEVVAGATRDMRVTIVGDRAITSASYWRVKSPEALSRPEWTPTATRYNTRVDHADIPAAAVAVAVDCLRRLDVRTAGVDLIWPGDDVTSSPLILEFSPYYQPNPPKPERYQHLSYKAFKTNWPAPGGYLERQYFVFRDIASQILDQGLF